MHTPVSLLVCRAHTAYRRPPTPHQVALGRAPSHALLRELTQQFLVFKCLVAVDGHRVLLLIRHG